MFDRYNSVDVNDLNEAVGKIRMYLSLLPIMYENDNFKIVIFLALKQKEEFAQGWEKVFFLKLLSRLPPD